MVEYTRLLNADWWQQLTTNWQPRDTVVVVAGLAAILVVGWLITKRR